MPVMTLDIIKQVMASAKEQAVNTPTKTRLIKLLYLVEVEYCKHYQKRLTNLKWQFYHYGPYSSEIEPILGSPDIEEVPFALKGGKSGSQYKLADDEVTEYVPWEIKRLVDEIVKAWGDVDLNKLLDHVYFDTEPMKNALRGDLLDFSQIKPWAPSEKVKDVRIDLKKLSALRDKYLPRIKKTSQVTPIYRVPDKAFLDCIKVWDEELSSTKLLGQVIVKFGEQKEK